MSISSYTSLDYWMCLAHSVVKHGGWNTICIQYGGGTLFAVTTGVEHYLQSPSGGTLILSISPPNNHSGETPDTVREMVLEWWE